MKYSRATLLDGAVLSLLLGLAVQVPHAFGQQCGGATCETCLAEFNCVWTKDGSCQEGCGSFPNIECYYERIFETSTDNNDPEVTMEQICFAAANNITDNEACFEETTSESCLQKGGCDWKMGRIENGEDRNWCALDLNYEPPVIPCTASTCNGCLSDLTATCVWMKSGMCGPSCPNRPNVECYDYLTFGVSPDTFPEICDVYNSTNSSMITNEECFAQTTQDDCFSFLQDEQCAWISTSPDDETVGHCIFKLESANPAFINSGAVKMYLSYTGFSVVSFLAVHLLGAWY